jgi:hypothetical protein
MEYFEKDAVSKQDIVECAHEFAWGEYEAHNDDIKSYDDCRAFYDWCNETINNFNK